MIRLTMLAFAVLTITLGAVVVGQANAQADTQANSQAEHSIGQDTAVDITVKLYIASMGIFLVTGWKAAKWDSKRDKEFDILRGKIKALEAQNAAE